MLYPITREDRGAAIALSILVGLVILLAPNQADGQLPMLLDTGDPVPRDIREMYDRGTQFLMASQDDDGSWSGGENGPGTAALGLLAFLASGEDANFGRYSPNIEKCLLYILNQQNLTTGYMGPSMYHHGFAMLAIAESYGAFDERRFSQRNDAPKQSLGEALELAVRCAITAQRRNPFHAWRYSPGARDADTSVSGAILMGLLAARNAGIEVPDESIDQAIAYFASLTGSNGSVGYSGGLGGFGDSIARSSIACLVYSISKRRDLDQYEFTKRYVTESIGLGNSFGWQDYARYYQAQALFQADIDAWEKWNTRLVRQLSDAQQENGSFDGELGAANSTSMALLALALNYRFLPIYER